MDWPILGCDGAQGADSSVRCKTMSFPNRIEELMRQCFRNLGESDWASRHVADRGPDLPAPSPMIGHEPSLSNLSVALSRMGLVHQSAEARAAEREW